MKEASTKFKEWVANPKQMPPSEIRAIIYNYGMDHVGDEEIWNQVLKLYSEEKDTGKKLALMSCLAHVKIPSLLSR